MDNAVNDAQYRRKRVAMMKKMIVVFAFALILIPSILCIVLFVRISNLENKIDNLMTNTQSASIGEQKAGISDVSSNGQDNVTSADAANKISSKEFADNSTSTSNASNNLIGNVTNNEKSTEAALPVKVCDKKVYLTFDDGPSDNTDAILDVLKLYNVKATFFVIQKTDAASIEKYKRILREGHTLAMHSSSHVYAKIYSSIEEYILDVSELQNYLYQVTGVKATIYRFPGGSSNTVSKISMNECVSYLNTVGITYFDWNVASGDAATGQISSETIVSNVLAGVEQETDSVVLMHDAKDKQTTVEALPGILQKLIDMGAAVLPITSETTPVHHKISK